MTSAITSEQRVFLRGLAHSLKPIVIVGQAGATDEVTKAVAQALLDHELIKVRMQKPADKKSTATELAQRAGAELCGLIGHTIILYKKHPKKPKIKLPSSKKKAALQDDEVVGV